MMVETLRIFFGWCIVINIGLFILSSILIISLRGIVSGLHSKIFNLDQQFISQTFYQYLGVYKIILIVFNIVPYFALKIMS